MRKYRVLLLAIVISLLFLPITSQASAEPITEAKQLLRDYYVDVIPQKNLTKKTIKGITDTLDPHTVYMTAKEYKGFINGIESTIVGIGVILEEHPKGIKIITVIPKGPAERAGIQPGDIITHVDKRSIVGKTVQTAIAWIGGEENTSVTLTLNRGTTKLTKKMKREAITLANVESTMLGGKVGYIRLNSFATESAREMNKAIQSLKGAESWIVDLRDNGGGYITSAQEIAGFFPTVDKAFQLRDRVNGSVIYNSVKQPNQFKMPVALLINENSASASEMVSGTVKEKKAATLYGQKSYGKGSMQSMFDFKDGSVLKMTTARFYSPGGIAVDKIGITPDIVTKVNGELSTAHQSQLLSKVKQYKKLPTLANVPVAKKFTVEMNTPMNWNAIDKSAVELIQLGGKAVSVKIDVKSDKEITVTPTENLISGEKYLLMIHPKWKNQQSSKMKQGIYLAVTVK